MLGELRGDKVPTEVGLGVTMQQQEGWTLAAKAYAQGGFTGVDELESKVVEHRCPFLWTSVYSCLSPASNTIGKAVTTLSVRELEAEHVVSKTVFHTARCKLLRSLC
jgi:hypothetical protein